MIFPNEKYAVVVSGISEGNTTFYIFNEATNQTLPLTVKVTAEKVAITDERIVDLGLSVNWANCNVGASEPQDCGDYFAWGEVETKEFFSTNNYKYFSNGKFKDIGSDISGTEYDAATHNMGNIWRMPTKAEYEELINKCEWKFVTYRKVRGWRITGPNGNSIFLPATGSILYDWNEDASIDGFYWSSNITDNHREVYTLFTTMHDYKMACSYMNCFEGRTIRAVTGAKGDDSELKTETFTVNGVSFKMIAVEGGTFWMGTADDDSETDIDECPRHQVTLNSYAIGETEVTQALWEAVMGENPSKFKGANRPVEQVNWNDCQTFISKLNALTGCNFRLPTEAEWEYAARGGKSSKGYKYAGSNDLDAVAWYNVNSYNNGSSSPDYGTHIVGTKSPNELGIYDMSGNVFEWCHDWYNGSFYSNSPSSNPCNTTEASERVERGGSWIYSAGGCRVAYRGYGKPSASHYSIGLRLALGTPTNDNTQAHLTCPDSNHPHMIDLGLPSGTKWACCNVGADKPEGIGGYYAWGETEEKEYYDWNTYPYCEDDWSKFYDLGSDISGTQYDVAHVKWGGSWVMPSLDNIQELFDNCKYEWVIVNGVIGGLFTSKRNGRNIFLPATGFRWRSSIYDHGSDEGSCWSSTQSQSASRNAYYLIFSSRRTTWSFDYRYYGHTVRPIVRN